MSINKTIVTNSTKLHEYLSMKMEYFRLQLDKKTSARGRFGHGKGINICKT